MRLFIIAALLLTNVFGRAQELYIYTDPASNVPAKAVATGLTVYNVPSQFPYHRFMQRYIPEVKIGLSKKWMLKAGASFADIHTQGFGFESVFLYAKYRLLSIDETHKHFRVSLFAEGSYTKSPFHFDEITLQGDKSGVLAGVVATQLWHKFALSASVSHLQVLDDSRNSKVIYIPSRIYSAMNYSVSGGLLVLPVNYTDYKQTNLNIYTEFLAQQSLDRKSWYVDAAPAVQLIFNSSTKLNLGYRFQLGGNMLRMGENGFLVGVEHTFLNAWGRR